MSSSSSNSSASSSSSSSSSSSTSTVDAGPRPTEPKQRPRLTRSDSARAWPTSRNHRTSTLREAFVHRPRTEPTQAVVDEEPSVQASTTSQAYQAHATERTAGVENKVKTPQIDPESPLTRFMRSLPPLQPSEIAIDCQDCTICQEPYYSKSAKEIPVKLPCAHIFGSDCISKWLSSPTSQRRCPLCRIELFKPNPSEMRPAAPPSNLAHSIDLLERLVNENTNTARRVDIMREARHTTHARVTAARAARSPSSEGTASLSESATSARQLLTLYRCMTRADLAGEELDIDEWEGLARCIRHVGIRHLSLDVGVSTLLNPVLRPLVVNLLERMTEDEGDDLMVANLREQMTEEGEHVR